jgi:hypothetical protein
MEDGRNEGRLILVSGATGQQGGAVARSLLGAESGYVRSPEIPSIQDLFPSSSISAPTAGRTPGLPPKADLKTCAGIIPVSESRFAAVAWSCA